jgi:diguanylate cyclase (GGDEF)-like protein
VPVHHNQDRLTTIFRLARVAVVLFGFCAAAALVALSHGLSHPMELATFGLVAVVAQIVLLFWGIGQVRLNMQSLSRAQESELDLSGRDALTGAWMRSSFLKKLRAELARSGAPVAYLQIDMDNLKIINDANGHGVGDQALVHLVRTIATILPGAVIGRLGGDEFGIALPGQDNRGALLRLAEHVLDALGQPVLVDGRELRLSATMGVALWPQDAGSMDELISNADLALYKGKKQGRALAVAFDPELLADERHKRFIERDLRAAILLDELELHYQPVCAPRSGKLLSYEALVRWNHPVRGRIGPAEFIAVAEQSNLIDKLGDWVLARALADLDRLGTPTVSVNVSPVQMRRTDFARRVAATLSERGIAGNRLVIEVTETLQLQSGAVELANIRILREAGVRIAIDDFGAGFASLGYLRGLPFDCIKIDRSYVTNLPHSRIDGLIVAAICKIGRAIGVAVIAEGVETDEQLAFLERAGVSGLQGFLLARPRPLAEIHPVLAAAA